MQHTVKLGRRKHPFRDIEALLVLHRMIPFLCGEMITSRIGNCNKNIPNKQHTHTKCTPVRHERSLIVEVFKTFERSWDFWRIQEDVSQTLYMRSPKIRPVTPLESSLKTDAQRNQALETMCYVCSKLGPQIDYCFRPKPLIAFWMQVWQILDHISYWNEFVI